MRFRLFDAVSGGTQVGGTVCVDNVPVTNGRFTASIDFGQQFVTPAARFLEIIVRADVGQPCTDDLGFVTLSPRQLLSATPLASHAKSAFALDASDGSPAHAVFVDDAGRVGIGTLNPTHTLHIAGAAPTIAIQDTDSTSQQTGFLSFRDAANAERGWMGYGLAGDPDLSIVNARTGGDIILNTFGGGGVGIGTTAPAAKLEVRGDIRLGGNGQLFATGSEENLRMVRGSVNVPIGGASITISAGAGFTPTIISRGRYQVTFTTPFNGAPTVTATAKAGNCDYIGVIESVSSAGCCDPRQGGCLWGRRMVRIQLHRRRPALNIASGSLESKWHILTEVIGQLRLWSAGVSRQPSENAPAFHTDRTGVR